MMMETNMSPLERSVLNFERRSLYRRVVQRWRSAVFVCSWRGARTHEAEDEARLGRAARVSCAPPWTGNTKFAIVPGPCKTCSYGREGDIRMMRRFSVLVIGCALVSVPGSAQDK